MEAPRLLALWHLTSLDAPTVAVTWCLAFAWAGNLHLPWWLPTVLGLSAWAFYIIDRLLDAQRVQRDRLRRISPLLFGMDKSGMDKSESDKSGSDNLRERHRFHWKHRGIFIPVALGAASIAVLLVVRDMPFAAQTRNSVLALASIAYLTSVHARPSLKIPKELLVAIVFTAACTLPVMARTPSHLALIPAALTFIALAWLNCEAIETWESALPRPIFPAALTLAAISGMLAALVNLMHHPRLAALLAAAGLSAILIACLDRFKTRLTPTTLRTAADLALLTPLVLLVIR